MPAKRTTQIDTDRLKAVSSYVDGMYDELDKLAKKAPREEISDLALTRVNRAIRGCRQTLGPPADQRRPPSASLEHRPCPGRACPR